MKYKVVRTYINSIDELQQLLDEGWRYKTCHQTQRKVMLDRYTYGTETCLEYILYKKENKNEKEN